MNLERMVKRELRGKAIPSLIIAFAFSVVGFLHVWLLYYIGTGLGPFMFWFLDPTPFYLPMLSGVVLVVVATLSALRAEYKYWTTFTYTSKTDGELPVYKAPLILHAIWPWHGPGLPADMQVLGPASINLIAKLFSILLLLGPASLIAAAKALRESYHVLAADAQRFATILDLAYAGGGRISFDSIKLTFPDFSFETEGELLLLIDGVVILHKEENGVALAARLEAKIRASRGDS